MKTMFKKIKFLTIFLFLSSVLSAGAQDKEIKKAIRFADGDQFDKAKSIFEKLIQERPNDGDVYYYFGESYLKSFFSDTISTDFLEVCDNARKLFEKGIEVAPNNPLSYAGLGKIAIYSGDFTKAKQYFDLAESKFPTKANKLQLSKEDQAEVLLEIGEAYITGPQKDVEMALIKLNRAAELDSKSPEIYLLIGDAYMLKNDGSTAKANFNKAEELDSKSPSAKLRVGKLWVRAKNWPDAIQYYKNAIEIDSVFAPPYLDLGVIYVRANQPQTAKPYFEKYVTLTNNINAKLKYVNVLIELEDYKEAISQLNDVIKVDSSRNDINRAFYYCFFEIQDYQKAKQYMDKFFGKVKPEKIIPSDYIYQGKIYQKLGQDSIAILSFIKATTLDSANCDLYNYIVDSYNKLKQYNEAIKCLKLKIAKNCSTPGDYFKMGLNYYYLKEFGKADTSLQWVTTNKPEMMNGKAWMYRGICIAMADVNSTDTNLAKQCFEQHIKIAKSIDSVKTANDLKISYDYLASYYYTNKKEKDVCLAREYWNKILAIDPNNKKALDLLKDTAGQCIK